MERIFVLAALLPLLLHGAEVLRPVIPGPWWHIAGDPELGEFTSAKQQPVDFAIWQATDGTWQLWSCIRGTKCGGKTRLFHRWEGASLTATNWKPLGIAMRADMAAGETDGGLQAPFVFHSENGFHMVYGDWEHICSASSLNGKQFQRLLDRNLHSSLFGEPSGANTRDPMVARIGTMWHCYYTAHPQGKGAVYCRTSKDLRTWNESRIVAVGGSAGTGPYSAECPFVVEQSPGEFYLFRTQRYGANAQTSVYHSKDPFDFGINNDSGHFVCTLSAAAPELIRVGKDNFIAALAPSLKGIQVAQLEWRAR